MEVCIVTVYNSINSGSFLQAFALAQVLTKMGHKVSFYKRTGVPGGSNTIKHQVGKGIKILIKKGLATSMRYYQSVWNFKKDLQYLNIIKNNSVELKNIDCFILGSDTIWNFSDEYFYNNYETYLGKKFFPSKVITYATSAANTTEKDCLKISEFKNIVDTWSAIGVRDENTKLLIEKIANVNANIVCDPIFLLSKSEYDVWVRDIFDKKYIFLYLFEKLSNTQIVELKAFAIKNNLKILNGGAPEKPRYCDKAIINSPFAFLSYIFYATYVVTDTFHGTAFSINFGKNFCVIDRGKKKVEDLLVRMDFDDRIVRAGESIISVINSKLKNRRDIIESFRKSSLEYLNKALEIDGENS